MSLNDLPKLHPRETIVNKASAEIGLALVNLYNKYDLTYGEILRILSSELASQAKYMIRQERHPEDPSQPGGLE